MDENASILEVQGITIYQREGLYYWTVKSCAFDNATKAFNDAIRFCNTNNNPEEDK